jgi:glycosyltransferase involved in cell wall biosynthesis
MEQNQTLDSCLLSVVVFTYNLEKYAKRCLDSILNQQVNFPLKVMIFDGFSTDDTISILEEYKKKYPDLIELHLAKQYETFLETNLRAYERLKTKYFTLLDGDDYWTDDTKLQKQIDFLEANPDFTICGHQTRFEYENNPEKIDYVFNGTKDTFDFNDLLNNVPSFMHTSSTVFRNVIFINGVPKKFYEALSSEVLSKIYSGDSIRNYIHCEKGKMKYFNECMSVYCIHEKATWSSIIREENDLSYLFLMLEVNNYFFGKYRSFFYRTILQNIDIIINLYGKPLSKLAENYLGEIKQKLPLIFFVNLTIHPLSTFKKILKSLKLLPHIYFNG